MNWQAEQNEVAELEQRLDFLRRSVETDTSELGKAEQRHTDTLHAQEILQLLSKAIQQKAHEKIAGVVTNCLQAVFGDQAYTFSIQFEMKRGKTEARLIFKRGEMEVDPISASGGGMINVAAFALRAACLVLHRPRLSPLLVLDEPFGHVSVEYQDNVRTMLEQLSKDLGVQLVMVTHNENYATGKIIRL